MKTAPEDLGVCINKGRPVCFYWDRVEGRYQVMLRDKTYGHLLYHGTGVYVRASIVRRKLALTHPHHTPYPPHR